MIDPAAAPLATGRACAPEQAEPAAAPKAPANNLEQFCLLMCRGLEVKKVSVHTSSKTPYSRIIWMHNDRSRFCIGKSKNANDAIDIPFTAIEEILLGGQGRLRDLPRAGRWPAPAPMRSHILRRLHR